MSTETKDMVRAALEVKAVDEDARTFRGLASTWDLDLGGDVIHRGAFRRTIDHWRGSGKPMPLIDLHNYGSIRAVVGKMVDAEETEEGLVTEWEIIEGPDGDEVMRRVKGGYIDSLSIGYRAVSFDFSDGEDGGQIRHIREVELKEVSLVIWGMNEGARIDAASIKSALDAMDEEQRQQIKALLEDPPAGEPEEPKGLATEAQDELRNALLRVQLRRLAARR